MIHLSPSSPSQRDDLNGDCLAAEEAEMFTIASIEVDDLVRRAAGIRHSEGADADWIPHNSFLPKTRQRSRMSRATANEVQRRTLPLPVETSRELTLTDQVLQALQRSGYPLQGVECECNEDSIVLRGKVTRYFYAQMALEIARQIAGDRRIDIQLQIVRAPRSNLGAVCESC